MIGISWKVNFLFCAQSFLIIRVELKKFPSWLGPADFNVGSFPSPRSMAGFESVYGKFFLFGGQIGTTVSLNDFHVLDPTTWHWTEIGNSTFGVGPSARSYLGFTACKGNIFLFGGGRGYGPDFFIFEPFSLTWTELTLKVVGDRPRGRSAPGFASVGGRLFLYGGCLGLQSGNATPIQDFHVYDPGVMRWQVIRDAVGGGTGAPWPPRCGFGFAAGGSSLFLLGGCLGCFQTTGDAAFFGDYLDDLYRFDTNSLLWTRIFPAASGIGSGNAGSTGDAPPPRAFHSMTGTESAIYVFGGFELASLFGDLRAMDLITLRWTRLSSVGGPSPRVGAALLAPRASSELWMFGGQTADTQDQDEMYIFNLQKGVWKQVSFTLSSMPSLFASNSSDSTTSGSTLSTNAGPGRRALHGFAAAGDGRLFVHGGCCDGKGFPFADLHFFEPLQSIWINASSTATSGPCRRSRHGFVFASQHKYTGANQNSDGSFFVFGGLGGCNTELVYLNDLFALNLSVSAIDRESAGQHGRISEFGFDAMGWEELGSRAAGPVPSARAMHGMAATLDGQILVFGGYNDEEGYLNDLFVFEPAALTWTRLGAVEGKASSSIVKSEGPSPRHSMGLAALGRKIYVMGGASDSQMLLGDLFEFDIDTERWAELTEQIDGDIPNSRSDFGFIAAAGAGSVKNSMLVIFGGKVSNDGPTKVGDPCKSHKANDIAVFDPVSLIWRDLGSKLGGNPPAARESHGLAATGGRAYIQGGYKDYGTGQTQALDDLLSFLLPQLVAWEDSSGLLFLVHAFDWDQVFLASHIVRLPVRVRICSVPAFPCALSIKGAGSKIMAANTSSGSVSEAAKDSGLVCKGSDGCTSVVLDSIVLDGSSGGGGERAVLEVQGSAYVLIKDCIFQDMSSSSDGGVILCYGGGTVTLESTHFLRSRSNGRGGAISCTGGKVDLKRTRFESCYSAGSGGAVYLGLYECYGTDQRLTTVLSMEECLFLSCGTTGGGGALSIEEGTSAVLSHSTFTSCFAEAGGALWMQKASYLEVSECTFLSNRALGAGGGAIFTNSAKSITLRNLLCLKNEAQAGGGGALFWVGGEPTFLPTSDSWASGIGAGFTGHGRTNRTNFTRRDISLPLHGCFSEANQAVYGPCVATPYHNLWVTGVPGSPPACPGLAFEVLVQKKDSYNQTIESDSSSVVSAQAVTGFGSQDPSLSVLGRSLVKMSAGEARLSLVLKPTFAKVVASMDMAMMASVPRLYFSGTDLESLVPMDSKVFEVSMLEGTMCPRGSVLLLDTMSEEASLLAGGRGGVCTYCAAGTYSVDPLSGPQLNEPACWNCPSGGVCRGGDNVRFELGEWNSSDGMFRLLHCPAGYQLVNSVGGRFSHDIQQCLSCGADQYVLDSSNPAHTCTACPMGAICNGSTLVGRVPGSVWVTDYTRGQIVLVSCPPSYELLSTLQMCQLCAAGYFCIGSSAASVACPDNSFAIEGANSSTACQPAVFVSLLLSLSMERAIFDDNLVLFREAVASAAGLAPERVVLQSVNRRELKVAVLTVALKLAASNPSQAQDVAARLSSESVSAQLIRRGLAPADVSTVVVQGSTSATPSIGLSSSMVTGLSVGIFFFMSIFVVGGYAIGLHIWKEASHRALLRELARAAPGLVAEPIHLPWKIRREYVAVQVVGRGQFGVVLRVRPLSNGRRWRQPKSPQQKQQLEQTRKDLAIKLVVPKEGRNFDERHARQLAREARALELLTERHCEHAVQLRGLRAAVVRPEVAWFVMELLDGDGLDAVVRDQSLGGVLSDRECIRVARSMLAALKVLHSEGIVHRDVKPANIMRVRGGLLAAGSIGSAASSTRSHEVWDGESWDYKLVDFGTALGIDEKLAGEAMMTLAVSRRLGAGTPPYMSPEMFKEPDIASYASDLWSLGVTLFELACGTLPFEAESELLWSHAIAGDLDARAPCLLDRLDEDRRARFDRGLADVVATAVEKRIVDRFATADEMHEAVYTCLIRRGEAVYSVFLSYRVATDEPLARLLFDELNHSVTPGGHRVTVYWDAVRLVKGEDWEDGFATGLLNSLCVLPLLSYGATAPLAALPEEPMACAEALARGWEERPANRARLRGREDDVEDNVLKELLIAAALLDCRTAAGTTMAARSSHPLSSSNTGVARQGSGALDDENGVGEERGLLQLAYPLLIGRPHPPGHSEYPRSGNFFMVQAGGGVYPTGPSPATARAVARFLHKRAGLTEAVATAAAVRGVGEVVRRFTQLQGALLWETPAGLAPAELSHEQRALVGRGYVGPPVDLDGPPLTEEQRQYCSGGVAGGAGLDEEQLKMLKAQVRHLRPAFHEIIDRAALSHMSRCPSIASCHPASPGPAVAVAPATPAGHAFSAAQRGPLGSSEPAASVTVTLGHQLGGAEGLALGGGRVGGEGHLFAC